MCLEKKKKVAYPVIANCGFLVAPCFGRFVDSRLRASKGFAQPIAALLALTQLAAAACCLPDALAALWPFLGVADGGSDGGSSDAGGRSGGDDGGVGSRGSSFRAAKVYSLYAALALLALVQSTLYPLQFACVLCSCARACACVLARVFQDFFLWSHDCSCSAVVNDHVRAMPRATQIWLDSCRKTVLASTAWAG